MLRQVTQKVYNQRVEKYILDCMRDKEYYHRKHTKTRFQILKNAFINQACYPNNFKALGSIQNVLSNWFAGLPTCFDIDYMDYDIIEITKKMAGRKELSETRKNMVIKGWFNYIAYKTIKTAKKYGVDFMDVVYN